MGLEVISGVIPTRMRERLVMNISMKAAVVALVALSGGGALAQTTTVNFTYSGTAFGTVFSTGSGSFSFLSGPSAIGISNLTAFSFSTSRDIPGIGFTSTYTYGQADLAVFAANFTPSGDINELTIRTNELAPSVSSTTGPTRSFMITSWTIGTNTGAGQLFRVVSGGGFIADTAGTVTVTSIVPAPGAAALLGTGGLLVARRRRA